MDHSCLNFYFCVENDLRTDKTIPTGLTCNTTGASYLRNTAEDTFELSSSSPTCYVDIRYYKHLDLCECCEGGGTVTPSEPTPEYPPGTPGDEDDPFTSWDNFDQVYCLPLNNQDLTKLKNNTNTLKITKLYI